MRTIIMMHIGIAAAAGLVSGLGGWTLLRTQQSPKSPPYWAPARHGLSLVSLSIVFISVAGVVGSTRRSRNLLCCYMVSTVLLMVSQVTLATVLLNQLPELVSRRRPTITESSISSSSGELAEAQFWEQLLDAQAISGFAAFVSSGLMLVNLTLTSVQQLKLYCQSTGKKIPASVGGLMVPKRILRYFDKADTDCMIHDDISPGSPLSDRHSPPGSGGGWTDPWTRPGPLDLEGGVSPRTSEPGEVSQRDDSPILRTITEPHFMQCLRQASTDLEHLERCASPSGLSSDEERYDKVVV